MKLFLALAGVLALLFGAALLLVRSAPAQEAAPGTGPLQLADPTGDG
jgi:hypothetical protein